MDRALNVREALLSGMSGLRLSRLLADEMDALLIAQLGTPPAGLALVAVGGLGRRERSPKSDVDLLLLHDGDEALAGNVRTAVDAFLYKLWDEKLELGQRFSTASETLALCEMDDATLTSHLDARLLAGDVSLFERLQADLQDAFSLRGPAYVERLLEPIAERGRAESLVFVLEPNLKTGPGGLRDIHQIGWVLRFMKNAALSERERTQLLAARSFYLRTRAQLHLLTGRRQDQLSFELQRELTDDVERLLGRHYRHAQQVIDIKHRLFLRIDEERRPRPRLALPTPKNGRDVLNVFLQSLTQQLPIPDAMLDALPALVEDGHADLFWRIIDHPYGDRALVDMHYAGVLGRYLPEFGRTQGMVQADFYHCHTVDVHSLRVVELLYALRRGEGDAEFQCVDEQSFRSLAMACLFHDAGKRSGRDHAEYGADLVEQAMLRLGSPLGDVLDAQLLVREHLTMPKISQRRDLSDPATIEAFAATLQCDASASTMQSDASAATMQSEARLKRLYVLSYVDTNGTAPGLWTPWKAALLKELFERTLARLRAQPLPLPERPQRPPGVSLDAEAHGHRALWVVTPDRPGLLALVAGLCASKRVSIAGADVFSSGDGVAMDRFMVRYSAHPERAEQRYAELVADIAVALKEKRSVESVLAALPRERLRGPRPVAQVTRGERGTLGYVLEVSAADRAGLLFDLARTLYEQGYSIHGARIVTEGARAIDAFFVTPEPTDALLAKLIASA